MKKSVGQSVLLIVLGLAAFGGGGFEVYLAHKKAKVTESSLAQEAQACQKKVAPIGNAVVQGNDVVVTVDVVYDPRTALADATAAEAVCPSHRISEMCIGELCAGGAKAPGTVPMTFTLQQIPPSER